jgi:hypothetical protein
MSDRELLESAAKAAGIDHWSTNSPDGLVLGVGRDGPMIWNPINDDGDAFRLAVKLGIDLHPREFGSEAVCMAEGITIRQLGEPEESARLAIVRVAAGIGELLTLSHGVQCPAEPRASNLLDPERSVWLASGFELDAIGAHESIQLRRNQVPRLES